MYIYFMCYRSDLADDPFVEIYSVLKAFVK